MNRRKFGLGIFAFITTPIGVAFADWPGAGESKSNLTGWPVAEESGNAANELIDLQQGCNFRSLRNI